jgi:hypothetical protein
MHDGGIAASANVLEHYAAGGTVTASEPNAGDGNRRREAARSVPLKCTQ